MKISGIRTRPYYFTLDRRMGDANFPIGRDDQSGMVLYVDTDEGISGVSLTSPSVFLSLIHI